MVFPVQGAMTNASMGVLGPRGSASAIVHTGARPVMSKSRFLKLAAVPKRLSVLAAVSLMIGTIS